MQIRLRIVSFNGIKFRSPFHTHTRCSSSGREDDTSWMMQSELFRLWTIRMMEMLIWMMPKFVLLCTIASEMRADSGSHLDWLKFAFYYYWSISSDMAFCDRQLDDFIHIQILLYKLTSAFSLMKTQVQLYLNLVVLYSVYFVYRLCTATSIYGRKVSNRVFNWRTKRKWY